MQPKKEKQEELSDDEVAQQTKTFIGVNNPRIPEQAVKKEDLEYLHSDATCTAATESTLPSTTYR